MRLDPVWAWFTSLAHTLPRIWPSSVREVSRLPDWLCGGARGVAAQIPGAHYVTLEGTTTAC